MQLLPAPQWAADGAQRIGRRVSMDRLQEAADYLLSSHDYAVFTGRLVTKVGEAHLTLDHRHGTMTGDATPLDRLARGDA